MWIAMSDVFRLQREKYNLKESCEDCRHYCSERDKCAVMYPTAPHRRDRFTKAKDNERIYFCKMFEAK
jgi:hypothetical protein